MDLLDRHFTPRIVVAAAFAGAPPVDGALFRADMDALASQLGVRPEPST
jgi:hypothetical protein